MQIYTLRAIGAETLVRSDRQKHSIIIDINENLLQLKVESTKQVLA